MLCLIIRTHTNASSEQLKKDELGESENQGGRQGQDSRASLTLVERSDVF